MTILVWGGAVKERMGIVADKGQVYNRGDAGAAAPTASPFNTKGVTA